MNDSAIPRGTDSLELELRHLSGVHFVNFIEPEEADEVVQIEIGTDGVPDETLRHEVLRLSQAYLDSEVHVTVLEGGD